MDTDSNIPSKTRLIPLTDWPKYHPWPPLGGLRHLVFYSKANGFDKVLRRAGRRVLIDEEAFFKWIESISHLKEENHV
jgi:hypothetical protein